MSNFKISLPASTEGSWLDGSDLYDPPILPVSELVCPFAPKKLCRADRGHTESKVIDLTVYDEDTDDMDDDVVFVSSNRVWDSPSVAVDAESLQYYESKPAAMMRAAMARPKFESNYDDVYHEGGKTYGLYYRIDPATGSQSVVSKLIGRQLPTVQTLVDVDGVMCENPDFVYVCGVCGSDAIDCTPVYCSQCGVSK